MKYIVTFDFGTTAIKCAIIDEDLKVIYSNEKDVITFNNGIIIEQDPNSWYEIFKEISKDFFDKGYKNSDISGVVFSGHMQDLIFVDAKGNSLSNAILYNDQRGESQLECFDSNLLNLIEEKTANKLNGSIPLLKLLWLKKENKSLYEKTNKILFSSKDFIITRLTGEFVSDVISLSTSGMMDIKDKEYIKEIEKLNIDLSILPKICYADEIAGLVTEFSAQETGYMVGTKVYVGSGDAGATTLASGISQDGEININLGTSGWVASISKAVKNKVFNLAAINHGLYINVIPVLNAGNVHKWLANAIDGSKTKYDILHNAIVQSIPCSNDLYFLPYIVGERFPVSDANVRGCYIGINANTTKADIIRSTLEGVAFSIKQSLLALDLVPIKISLIGGGAKDDYWNQIFADILGVDVIVYENSQFLPSMALASIVMLEQDKIPSYDDFVNRLINNTESQVFIVNKINNEIYNKGYQKFIKIYPAVKNLFK
jgi:xylulokinase